VPDDPLGDRSEPVGGLSAESTEADDDEVGPLPGGDQTA
jgi:hypothetical protein